ncbi:Uncharacterized conserved protein [Leminorella richardii]|uniref:Uncharacterized conserved protein n=1 Tax=Leminorella richardii TaxID=158841 RepID=A0A2X4USG6_9GAMM|nr:PAAR domain-containing protein [Leminorella richardii]SQI35960.1 Uncharacterized conserved protein [Leminorella richardii]
MLVGVIRLGDKTTHGGTVISASSTMTFHGVPVARLGDSVTCPLHNLTVIAEGNASFTDNGIPIAFDGHQCACGCRLIASLRYVTAG